MKSTSVYLTYLIGKGVEADMAAEIKVSHFSDAATA